MLPIEHQKTVLVVEDLDVALLLTCEVLGSRGFKVLQAVNGKEALKLCRNPEVKIDLVLSDVVMPEMDGMELFEELHNLETHPKVMLTSVSALPPSFRKKHPDCKFITKSHDIEKLTTEVCEVLR
jgi:CheY-like chemotaxis protein